MDPTAFDDWTRGLGAARTRRAALKGLAGALLGAGALGARLGWVAAQVSAQGCKVKRCAKGQLHDACKQNHDCCQGLKCGKKDKCQFKNGHGGAGDYCKNDGDCDADFFCKKNQCIPDSCKG